MKNKNVNKNLIEGIVLMLLSSFLISESIKLRGGEAIGLSPALFPLIISSFLLLFSILLIIKGIKLDETKEVKGEAKAVLLVIVISFIYLILLPKIHFILTSILYLLAFLLILGERRWKVLLLISTLTPILVSFIFANLLDVLLP